MKPLHLTINIDGGSRGNPGPAGFAFVIAHDGETVLDGNGRLGHTTNNVAEYTALVRALEKAAELKAQTLEIRSDSELLVRQMNGQYKVKNANLLPLFQQAQELRREFAHVTLTHVPREQNREADRLCNEAMDGKVVGGTPAAPRSVEPAAARPHKTVRPTESNPSDLTAWRSTLGEAERIIRDAQFAWVEEGADSPSPRDVLQVIIQLLESRKFLRKPD